MKKPEWLKFIEQQSITSLMIGQILPFQGSSSSDFESSVKTGHPFKPCPGTPNCVIHAIEFRVSKASLFKAAYGAIREISPHHFSVNPEILQIEAVFRIPLFGFRDDVKIHVESNSTNSILHIRSASRIGHSDLGVNRRRVKRILKLIKSKL